jgi:hypothetical protein
MLLGNFSARWVLALLISFGELYYFRNKIQCFITKPSEKCLNRISQLKKAGKKNYCVAFPIFFSIIIKFGVRLPPRPFDVIGGATTRFLSLNIIRQTKVSNPSYFYNA